MTVKDLARPTLASSPHLSAGNVHRRGWSSQVFHCHCIPPCTNFTSVFRAKRQLTSHSALEVADQSQTSGCLVTSGRCWPSAADEEWYSPKRPSSTVAVNSSELNTKVSAPFPLVATTLIVVLLQSSSSNKWTYA